MMDTGMLKWIFSSIILLIIHTSIVASPVTQNPSYAFEQNERLGRGVNILSDDPRWKSKEDARMKERHFEAIKEAGFDHVRIAIKPFKFASDQEEYIIDPIFYETLDWAIENALKNDLLAIVDLHEHGAMGANPLGKKAMFLSMWKQIANHCKDYPNEVLFEIANEPNMKAEIWNELNAEAYTIMRESNPQRTLLIGPIYGNQIKYLNDLELPEHDSNIIVPIHYYMPIQFTHQGAPWSTKNKDLSGIQWTNSADEEAEVIADFNMAQAWSKAHNRPLTLGEFGAYEKADMDSRTRWTHFISRQADLRGWSWSYWQFDKDFIVYDLDKDQWVAPIKNTLIPMEDPFRQNKLLGRGINLPSIQNMELIDYQAVRNAGFSHVRIPIYPFAQTEGDKEFTLKASYLNMLDGAIKKALSNDLMAIIDFHEHHAMEEDPLGNKSKFLAIWKQLANRFKDSPQEVLFEIANEPNMKPETWNQIHREAHKIIRASNPKRTLLIGPIYGNQIKFLKDLALPKEDQNIIVTIHYYMPIQFTHQGAPWSSRNKNLSGIEWPSEVNPKQAIIDDFNIAEEWSMVNLRPIHLGEFGVYNKTDMESRIRWTNFVTTQAENRNWSWCYWELNQGFGIYNLQNREWKEGLLNALIPQGQKVETIDNK